MFRTILCAFLSLTLLCPVANGCTAFCFKNNSEVLFGKNYDWSIGDGMIFVNKRNMAKVASPENEKKVLGWVSKYGSITFNQYGWEQPSGGMNEAGLVIEADHQTSSYNSPSFSNTLPLRHNSPDL
jgi:choloylglycine hydrolase